MKIYNLISFKGVREDRNTTEQLKKKNEYALTENNQKRISKSIENLSKEKGERNLDFLLDVAENLQYGTSIDTGAKPSNDWKTKLKEAAEKSLTISDPILREKYEPRIKTVFDSKRPLSETETEILEMKKNILENLDREQLKTEKNRNIANVEGNLNSFIVSSETPLHQKKYILNRFQYLLSPDYKINPQLKDKKTIVLAEMLNDLVVNNNNGGVPNTKAINQKHHGMCAAISISRKLMSYEYKDKYVDTILSELDDSDEMSIYDLAYRGQGKKVPVKKTFVDFEDALNKGYRIVDASTTQWMNIGDMQGIDNISAQVYTAFDPSHLGTFTDTHCHTPLEDNELQAKQSYYQALIKAKEAINKAKINNLENKFNNQEKTQTINGNLEEISELNSLISKELRAILPTFSKSEIRRITGSLLNLENNYTNEIDRIKDGTKKYHYVTNEEDVMKERKIKSFLKDTYGDKVDTKVLDEKVGNIRDLIEMSNNINKTISGKSTISGKIRQDRNLFEAAAAYRTSLVFSLYDDDLKTDAMIYYDIPDVENHLSNTIGRYMEIVQKGDKRYIDYFSKSFDGVEPNRESVLKLLNGIKGGIDYTMNEKFDDLYFLMGATDRKTALKGQLKMIIGAIERNDKEIIRNFGIMLDVRNNKAKILKKLNQFDEILSNNPTNAQYNEIFNKLGNKNQMEEIALAFEILTEAIKDPDSPYNEIILEQLKLIHKIPKDAPVESLQPVIMAIATQFNEISENMEIIRKAMDVKDNEGNVIDSATPTFTLIKKMENSGKIIPMKELLPLQKRYDAIDKLRSQDEFSSRQGKISDPALYKYTKGEKETLKKIKHSINAMHADVNKEMTNVFRNIRKPLEEHTRKYGVNTGFYWVWPEGSSGLYSRQQAKILQQLTDKPYEILEDFDKAFDIIKNSPHSGISGTHVFHDKLGGHAQYIAEISEENGKEVLYHDNSWGASEHENTWIDSENLMRTDYSDHRGGELGYITNSKWRNGNYVDNLLYKTGEIRLEKIESKQIRKLKNEHDSFKYPLMNDIVAPMNMSDAQELDNIVQSIKDDIFANDARWLPELESMASKMTVDELKSAKLRVKTASENYKVELKNINKRLSDTPFEKGISSKAQFDALPDNDPLKVVFEKAALKASYKYTSLTKQLALINNVQDLKKLREERRQLARKNFDYAFSKDPEILYSYALNKNKNQVYNIVKDGLKKYNVEVKPEDVPAIFRNTAVYMNKEEKKQYDGSLKNTIEFMLNKISNQYDKVVPQSENAQKAKEEIINNIRADLNNKLYFALYDLGKETPLNKTIIKYIDRKFNPTTDEEFVEIYKKLQDMTTEEFNAITTDVTDEDMNFKNVTGYDMVKKYKASQSKVREDVENLVYQKYLYSSVALAETEPSYRYKKLYKKPHAAVYVNRPYDDLYRTFVYTLGSMNYEKMFNKNKEDALIKYGAMPAYPKINIVDDNLIMEKFKIISRYIETTTSGIHAKKLNIHAYELTESVEDILNKHPDNQKLTEKERRLVNNFTGEFITYHGNDITLTRSIKSATNMLELDKNATVGDYKKHFKGWQTEMKAIKQLNSVEDLFEGMKRDLEILSGSIANATKIDIPIKFRGIIHKKVNNIVSAEIKALRNIYDQKREERKIKNRLLNHSKNNVQEKDIENFYNNLSLLIQDVKSLKGARENIAAKQGEPTKKLAAASFELFMTLDTIPEDKFEELNEKIEKISNNEFITDHESLSEALLKTFSKYSGKSQEEIQALPSFKAYAGNLWKMKLNNKSLAIYSDKIGNKKLSMENLINRFVDKNIKSEYTQATEKIIVNFVKHELNKKRVNVEVSNTLDTLEQELLDDYRKYNYMNHPVELLDRFLELSAKDGPISKATTEKEKEDLIQEKRLNKGYLETAFGLSSIVEMQETLMHAAEIGNPALVVSKFKNYDTGGFDPDTGASLTLSDPDAIDFMVRTLILDNDYNTAIMFVEKLGLTDEFLKIEDDMLDVKNTKKKVDKIANIIRVTNMQNKIIQEELNNYPLNEEYEGDFSAKLEQSKQRILAKTKHLSRKKNIELIMEGFDKTKEVLEAGPDLSKNFTLLQCMNELNEVISTKTTEDIEEIQRELKQIKTVCEMIEKIHTPEYREASKYKESIMKKFKEITEYNDEVLKKVVAESSSLKVTGVDD